MDNHFDNHYYKIWLSVGNCFKIWFVKHCFHCNYNSRHIFYVYFTRSNLLSQFDVLPSSPARGCLRHILCSSETAIWGHCTGIQGPNQPTCSTVLSSSPTVYTLWQGLLARGGHWCTWPLHGMVRLVRHFGFSSLEPLVTLTGVV